ncbi:hypothetical protein CPB84DRAFT_1783854 [Gymnopilus junonius]|uniref:Uncharacterized protein n=1 Tax=Gymnopilus junonius TaxID=109634 RepID=A0A9P5TKC3_GYMJU|nr:hypothetical protein CPB84DRAFT_1783854 [Gymnopilus junonius]
MEPHLTRLLATNDPPPEDSMQEITQLMAGPLHELAQANQRIADLEAQLQSAKESRERSKTPCTDYHTIMSPIPDEAPLLLTRISSGWRSLYISFCDDYRIATPFAHAPHGLAVPPAMLGGAQDSEADLRRTKAFRILTQRAQIVQEWLARSGTCPLSISLSYTSLLWNPRDLEEPYHPNDPTTKLFLTLLAHSHHLRSLELIMPIEIYRQLDDLVSEPPADAVVTIDLSALRDLKASLYEQVPYPYQGGDTNTSQIHPVALFTAPNLRRISMDGYPSNGLWAQKTLPFANGGMGLRYFSCHLIHSHEECLGILTECPNLVYCRFHLGPVAPTAMHEHGRGVTHVSMPLLRAFAVVDAEAGMDDTSTSFQFFSAIDAPSMHYGDVPLPPPPPQNGTAAHPHPSTSTSTRTHPLLPLLAKSLQLRRLTIDPYSFSPAELRGALRVVSPTVRHLVVGQEALPYDSFGDMKLDFGFLVGRGKDQSRGREAEEDEDEMESSKSSSSCMPIPMATDTDTGAPRCAPLKLVRVLLTRPKKVDIKEALELYCREHGRGLNNGTTHEPGGAGPRHNNLRLEMEYDTQAAPIITDPLSSSYGLQNDRLWPHLDLDLGL